MHEQIKQGLAVRKLAPRGPKRRHAVGFFEARLKDIRIVLEKRYRGTTLPDDDAVRADVAIYAQHLAASGETISNIVRALRCWCEWMTDRTARDIAKRAKPIMWRARRLGIEFRLTAAERAAWRITTIAAFDQSPEEAAAAAKERKRERDRARRARKSRGRPPGRPPRSETAPWVLAGVSRATFFRHKRAAEAAKRETKTPRRSSKSRSVTRETKTPREPILNSGAQFRSHTAAAAATVSRNAPDGPQAPSTQSQTLLPRATAVNVEAVSLRFAPRTFLVRVDVGGTR